MRLIAATLLCASVAFGQTEVNAAVTAGLSENVRTGGVQGIGAVRLEAVHGFESRAAVRAAVIGELLLGTYFDLGSSISLEYRPWSVPVTYTLKVVPFNPARIREAFDYADAWGAALQGPAPVVMASAQTERFRVWGALQGAPLLDNLTSTTFVALSGILGGAAELPTGLRAELNLGVHDRGNVPSLAQQGVRARVTAFGGSGRLSWSHGGGVGPQVDFTTYSQDPERYERFFTFDSLETPTAAWLGLEGGVTAQNLQDPAVFATQKMAATGYVDFQARVRLSALRLFGTVRVQPVSFVQFDTPGLPPFFTPPTPNSPLIGAWLGADYRFASIGLEPGLQVRLIQAGVIAGCLPGAPSCSRPVLVYSKNRFTILPLGSTEAPIVGVKGSLRYQPFPFVMVVGEADYERDTNGATFNAQGEATPTTLSTVTLRLLLQGRF